MQIVDDRILLFRTKNPDKYRMIPRHEIVGEPAPGIFEIAVKWGLDEVRVLRNLGVKKAPSPIQGRYKWPGRHKPFHHQIATASFLTLNNRAYVFNEPGTGKTSSCLWAADYLMFQKRVRRCLIVCPLSIMEAAWMKDIMTFVIHRRAAIAHASSMEKRIDIIEGDEEFVIINFDGLEGVSGAIKDDGRFDLVIIDEANYIKNSTTKRWKALNSILTPDTLVWALTGTPAPQGPMDAYGLAKLVTPHTVPRFKSAWQDATMRKLTQFKWAAKPDAGDKVHAALQPAIRFTKEMCLDLPEILTVTRKVPLTPQQEKYYRIMKSRAVMEAAGETITAANAATVLNKLLQISAGAAYTDSQETIVFDCAPRFKVLSEVLEETQRKVLVFAPYRHSIDTIAQMLYAEGVPCAMITGDVSATRRGEIFNDFQTKPHIKVLVIQPQAASHGVTLTEADTVVFWGPVMSVETYLQCIARAHRIGQKGKNVTVVHLQGSEIEARMFKQLESRVEDHSAIMKIYDDEMLGKGVQ
jgi:SNF2 family DNA or RNA helicase